MTRSKNGAPRRIGRLAPGMSALAMAMTALALPPAMAATRFELPAVTARESVSVEEALSRRRTIRHFDGRPLTVDQMSRLLWAAQGISDRSEGKRTAPSAGALYPLEVYAIIGSPPAGTELKTGVYRYLPREHSLVEAGQRGDQRPAVARAALGQDWMSDAASIFLIAADFSRTTIKYGERGLQYVHQEAGAAAQNLLLEAQALGLRAGIVGAFRDEDLAAVLGLPSAQVPLLLLPVGP